MSNRVEGLLSNRFIIIEQTRPKHFFIEAGRVGLIWNPLKYELIDRGRNFVVGEEDTLQETILARFVTLREAQRLHDLLVREG